MGLRLNQQKALRHQRNRRRQLFNLQRSIRGNTMYLTDLIPEEHVITNKGLLYHAMVALTDEHPQEAV